MSVFSSLFHPIRNMFPSPRKPVELSFSRVQAYLRCPWMHHLIYDLDWKTGPKSGSSLGLSLHRTLDAYLKESNTVRSWERMQELYDQLWVNEGFESTQQTLEHYQSGQAMLARFVEIDRGRTSEVVATEKEFHLSLPGIEFRGTIDRIDRATDGTYEIIEYKTNADRWTGDRAENDLQMTLYEIGAREGLTLEPVRLKYYFLSTGEFVGTRRTKEQIDQARRLLSDVASKIRHEAFPPNHGYCGQCGFGARCVNFKKGTV